MRTREEDLAELMAVAGFALTQALADGDKGGHLAGEWLTESISNQLEHARNHINATFADLLRSNEEEDLNHAICRLVMAKALATRVE